MEYLSRTPVVLVTPFVFLVTLFVAVGLVTTPVEAQPNKGGFKTRDLPANALFSDNPGDALQSDALNGPAPYIDGEERVTSFIGRREGQFVLITSNKATSGRRLCLYDEQDQIDPAPPCGDFSGCRVAKMTTARIQDDGADLRILTVPTEVPLWVNLNDDRQNLWHVMYDRVLVTPLNFVDGKPTAWTIEADLSDGTAEATVSRIIDNQFCCPVGCSSTTGLPFSFPFHLTVTLQ